MVSEGAVSAGHARALLSVSDPELMARKIVDEGLNVRDIERIVQEEARGETQERRPGKPKRGEGSGHARARKGAGGGARPGRVDRASRQRRRARCKIGYKTLEQLDALCRRLKA